MDLYPTPENPAPLGAEAVGIMTRDKVRLRAMRAVPEDAIGTVVVLGGRGDYFERYFETMRDLMDRGFAVASVDFRGQGGSQRFGKDPHRGLTRSFSAYEEDIRAFMETAVLPHCPPPYHILAHSTGGHIALRVLHRRRWFERAVLVSPLVDVIYGPWPRSLAAVLVWSANLAGLGAMYLPGVMKRPMGRSDFDRNPLTSDKWRWNRDSGILETAPQLGLGGATFSWLRAARTSLRKVQRMGQPTVPVLIVAAGADRVVSNQAIRKLAREVPGIALAVVPNARHEILSERDAIRRQFLAAFDSFIPRPG